MDAVKFAFWLQGGFELGAFVNGMTPAQAQQVKDHLALVFQHDPSIDPNKCAHPAGEPVRSEPLDGPPQKIKGERTWMPAGGPVLIC